ncbi:MAG: tRNA (adenine-N1)-methyltransferase [Candidatus Nezhaarchaeota archaeon]|nr:tRNA (adenine-N1)-methyltransferase [Candidatus Nezhaarchaeota archaeon]MCX8141834.1 tRNA (adenine-N1)-methyltransferase [Candidatus Nezhaarchaeota archaeon]MDW8050385.1 tRNA (adenine-N1)-methyltransferase [Nitrososphaerota archaeon]
MALIKQEDEVREGSEILLHLDKRRNYLVRVERERKLHTHKGYVNLSSLIGLRYGSKIKSSIGVEFVVLQPTLWDYVLKVARRTQVMYPKDIAIMIFKLGLRPGMKVVEAGTGSGALTCALAFFVKPGIVYSYEINPSFQEVARKNLERAGLLDYVSLKLKDITQGIDEEDIDAVVLDMATPWLVVPHAYKALKGGGHFACFSPTINQVEKTFTELKRHGFIDIRVYELLLREIKVEEGAIRPEMRMIGHTGYIMFARKSLGKEVNE